MKSTLVNYTGDQLNRNNQRHQVRMEHLRGVNDNIVNKPNVYSTQLTFASELARKKLAFSTVIE